MKASDAMLRTTAGIEEVDDIIEDIEQGFEGI